jgi:uncharacterized protein (DUF608 family)
MTTTSPLPRFLYEGERARHIAFPLGGIGAGGLAISGSGRLVDWSIRNRPNLQSFNGHTHFAIKAMRDGELLDARVLNGPYDGVPAGSPSTGRFFDGFGWGANRNALAGAPHFSNVRFTGRFPVAELDFRDPAFPGAVSLTAWSPFIPTNDRDSSFPGAIFEVEIANIGARTLDYTVAGTLGNHGCQNGRHLYSEASGVKSLFLTSDDEALPDWGRGDLTLATDAGDVDHMDYHFRGQWFDDLRMFWREFARPGRLPARRYDAPRRNRNMFDQPEHGTLAARVTLAPGETRKLRFVIAWHFPVGQVYWRLDGGGGEWRNYYASQWADSSAVVVEIFDRWDALRNPTFAFRDTLFGSSLPADIIDAVQGSISVLRTGTVLRLEHGEIWGWEGIFTNEGSCQGSCSHVWNYQQALPYLFPALERTLRETDYAYNQLPNGGLTFRQIVPLGSAKFPLNPCADGHLGSIIKTFRDWKISGDTEWLRALWPHVRAAIEYVWSPDNPDQWDPARTGVLWGRQHHTLDMELFGPNSWLSSMYVAALRAGGAMAHACGEAGFAAELDRLAAAGSDYIDRELFNGEYFVQKVDLRDRALLEKFDRAAGKVGVLEDDFLETYWSEEYGQVKYQFGDGCVTDQILGQWHADHCGLGRFLDDDKVKSALGAVFRHNYRATLADHVNPCRVYAYENEGGVLVATWPEGATMPAVPAPYSEEIWSGLEYMLASHMILRGMVEEGLAVVRTARSRYDGHRRNPWNEIECGSYYARSMSSFALVNAWSGLTYDLEQGFLGFDPAIEGHGEWFWSIGGGWGVVSRCRGVVSLEVRYGAISLKKFRFGGKDHDIDRRLEAGMKIEFRIGEQSPEAPQALPQSTGDDQPARAAAEMGKDR